MPSEAFVFAMDSFGSVSRPVSARGRHGFAPLLDHGAESDCIMHSVPEPPPPGVVAK
jgi:hypothetical protein